MSKIRIHSDEAWDIASQFSNHLASGTRDLAALIDEALDDEREEIATIADVVGFDGFSRKVRDRKWGKRYD